VTTTTTLARSKSSVVLPERFAVEVTADDIMHGRRCDANMCPLALAVARWLRNQRIPFLTVLVTHTDLTINFGLDTLVQVQHYWHDGVSLVSDFDHGEIVGPRTVVLARLP